MEIQSYIALLFGLTTIATVAFFYSAAGNSRSVLAILGAWLLLQGLVGAAGFYTVTNTAPPRFILLVSPPMLLIALLFITKKGRGFVDSLNLSTLTLLHVIRIPVELVLFSLFIHKAVPGLMTFEGRNFDILSGLSAPLIYYFGFVRKSLNHKIILFWNIACLALLFNIVINAVLSTPSVFQKFAFDQPNVAILYFPFNWLPCCVVPLVLLSHLSALRQLLRK